MQLSAMRPTPKAILLLSASLFGSFFITLWLTEPPDLLPVFRPEALKTLAGSSNKDLLGKLSEAAFHVSGDMMSNVDELTRQADKSVHIAGWALDRSGDGVPIIVSVYVAGQARLTVNTAGSRNDVTNHFNLPKDLARNVAFSGTLTCKTSDEVMVLAVSPADGRYGRLNPLQCP